MELTRIEPTRIQHIMIRPKAVGKRTKPKRLYKRIKYIRTGKIIVRIRITYDSIGYESVE